MQSTLEAIHRADSFIGGAISRLESRLRLRVPSILGYSRESIASRLAQIVTRDFYPRAQRAYAKTPPSDHASNMCVALGIRPQNRRFSFTKGEPELKVSVPFVFFRLFEMCAIFVFFFGKIAQSLVQRSVPVERTSIFLCPGLEAYLDENSLGDDFHAFAQLSAITVLRETPRLLVQHDKTQKPVGHIHFSKSPWKDIAKHTSWSFSELLQYVVLCLKTLSVSLYQFSRRPELSLLSRDLGFHPLITLLSKGHKLDRVFLTLSGAMNQEIWLNHLPDRTFKTEMIWYASNTQPLRYNQSAVYSESPPTRFIQVDRSWTWNRSHADWIMRATSTLQTEICGPIVYSLPEARHFEPNEKKFDLVLFDVTPVYDEWIEQNVLPGMYYYYQAANMKKFISDIIAWAEEQTPPLRIGLKAKREYKSIHDQSYIQFIETLVAEKRLVALPSKKNIYDVVSEAASIIVIPFSSPISIGTQLGVPSLFYDSSGYLDRPLDLDAKVGFANSSEALRSWLDTQFNAHGKGL
jgi:polysaccharide biosynthesis PFTS motif protein